MPKEKLWLKPEHFDTLHLASLANGGIGSGQHFVFTEAASDKDRQFSEPIAYDDPLEFTKRDAADPKIGPHCAVGLIRWAGDGVLEIQVENDEAVGNDVNKKIDFDTWVKRTNADIHPKALPSGRLPGNYDQQTGEQLYSDQMENKYGYDIRSGF